MRLKRPEPRKPTNIVVPLLLLVIGAVLGTVAAFSGRWFAEATAGSYEVRAVITVHDSETTEGQNGTRTTWTSEALAEDGRAMRLPGEEAFGMAEPVVVRLSALTDRVLSVRLPNGDLEDFHDQTAKVVLMTAGALAVLAGGWLLVGRWRASAREGGTAKPVLTFLLGVVLAAGVVLSPAGFGQGAFRSATTVPVPDLSKAGLRTDPPPVVVRGGAARTGDVTLRALGVERGAPEGAAPWLSGFEVLTVRVEETRTAEGPPVAARLVADEHGSPELVEKCAGAPGALTGPAASGTRTGLLCFAVPPGFVPSYLLLGTVGNRSLLTL